jgi:DNA repair protein RadC
VAIDPDRVSGRKRIGIRIHMRVYEASLTYNLISLGNDEKIDKPEKAVEYLRSAFESNPMQESLWVILLDRKNIAIGRVMVTLGTLTCSLAHPREVFKPAILASAAAIVVAHNHPSGDPAPSTADVQLTRQLKNAAEIIGIDLLDHVIAGYLEGDPLKVGYYSFRHSGLL